MKMEVEYIYICLSIFLYSILTPFSQVYCFVNSNLKLTLLNRGDMPVGYGLRTTFINHKRLGDHWRQCIFMLNISTIYSFLSFFFLWLTSFVVEKSDESRRKLKDLLTNKKIFFFLFLVFLSFSSFPFYNEK
jgi:hypothetical protein